MTDIIIVIKIMIMSLVIIIVIMTMIMLENWKRENCTAAVSITDARDDQLAKPFCIGAFIFLNHPDFGMQRQNYHLIYFLSLSSFQKQFDLSCTELPRIIVLLLLFKLRLL